MAGYLASSECGHRNLDHRPELVADRAPLSFPHLPRLILQGVSFDPQLLGKTHQWDHDFRPNVDAFFLEPARRLEDGPDLHLRDFREHDPEATSAEAEHRVRLARTLDRLEEPSFA